MKKLKEGDTQMEAIIEIAPKITDTEKDKAAMMKDLRDFMLEGKADDDFLVFPPEEENELFEESNSVFTIDGKQKEFSYISSFNKDSTMYSFGQDNLGLWYLFIRTGLTAGKNLKGPFRSKEKLIAFIEG